MENNSLQRKEQPGTKLTISDKSKEISKIVVHVNMLSSFPLPAQDIIMWSESIERLVPDLDMEALMFVIDKYKTSELTWDRNKGIQNIFEGLKRVTRDQNNKLKLLNPIW